MRRKRWNDSNRSKRTIREMQTNGEQKKAILPSVESLKGVGDNDRSGENHRI